MSRDTACIRTERHGREIVFAGFSCGIHKILCVVNVRVPSPSDGLQTKINSEGSRIKKCKNYLLLAYTITPSRTNLVSSFSMPGIVGLFVNGLTRISESPAISFDHVRFLAGPSLN